MAQDRPPASTGSTPLDNVRAIMEVAQPGPTSIEDALSQIGTPVKRGRGRPRKHPLPTTDTTEAPIAAPQTDNEVDAATVERCAALEMNDTANGRRLLEHFGADLLVQSAKDAASSEWVVWTGRFWDRDAGQDAVMRVAQQLGRRIHLEADILGPTGHEDALDRAARAIAARDPSTWSDADRSTVETASKLPAAIDARRAARRRFATQTGNINRIQALLKCAAPYVLRAADDFDAGRLVLATERHTLCFTRTREPSATAAMRVMQAEAFSGVEEPFRPEDYEVRATVEAIPGHRREDLITKLMPVTYDPEATCPKWDAFLAEFLPSEAVRRCVQVYSGLGLTAVALQRVMFHYGEGANGKSVFMETLMRVLGPLGVGLPAASLAGDNRASGQQASPDIVRLIGARIVRVAELPRDAPLKEELVKVLTGGESMPVRNLFKGFIEFTPRFKAHMSGNTKPNIPGVDEGIWRRMLLIEWPVTVPKERRRELDDVVAEFVAEGPGILNWLATGVLTYLREGFVVPPEVEAFTQEHRDEQDPVGQFAESCIERVPGGKVQASTMYEAYKSWSEANAKPALGQKKFGENLRRRKFDTHKSGVFYYVDCRLHSVPDRPMTATGYAEPRG